MPPGCQWCRQESQRTIYHSAWWWVKRAFIICFTSWSSELLCSLYTLPEPVSSAEHRCRTVWYSESSRGQGMWPVETLWWASPRPPPVGPEKQHSFSVLAKPIQCVSWWSPRVERSLSEMVHSDLLSTIPPKIVESLNMSSDGELFLSQGSWLHVWVPLWKKVHFYAKTNSVTLIAAWHDPSFNPGGSKLPDSLHIASIRMD